jgi:Domain of unknown function (DUF4878)
VALALGSKRSTVATVASALAAMAVAAAVAGRSCRVREPGPEAAVRDFLHAAKTGDTETIHELIAPSTRALLEAEARRATDYVGAATRFTSKDLVSISTSSEGMPTPTSITVAEERGDHAVVNVVSSAGLSRVELVRVDGLWRIEIPDYGPVQ